MRTQLLWLTTALLFLGLLQPATAVEPEKGSQGEPTAPAQEGAGSVPSTDLNFDLLGESNQPALDPLAAQKAQRIEQKARMRRKVLIAHQVLGFVTLAALTATVVIGHLSYNDLYTSGDFTGRYQNAHLGLASATTVLFAGTGLLALLAPNPYPKPIRLDTALVHKASMAMATAGMVTQVILGAITASRAGHADQASLALGHVVVGDATWAFMATGVIAYFF
jgi:hypothetical protein